MEQDGAKNNDENVIVWEKRAILMVAFGLSGFGTLLGAISVYVRYLKHKIASHFHIKSFNISQIRESTVSDNADSEGISRRSSIRSPRDDDSRRASDNIGSTNVIIPSTLTGSIQGYEDLRPDEPPEGVSGSKTDEIQDFFGKVDELFRGSSGDQHEAYNILKANSDKLKEVPDYWWRFAKAAHLEAEVAEHQQDTESQKTLLLNAVAYAERAMKLDDNSADAHKWYAITQGSRGQFLKISERIQNGFIFKTHIDRAVELNPHDSTLHHLLGRFCFEVSQLSWVERRMAATLFSEPPTATIQEALNHFINAEKKGAPSLENRYYIGKCYITMSDNRNAAYWLNQASQVPVETPSVRDKKVLTALNKDLAKYRKYL